MSLRKLQLFALSLALIIPVTACRNRSKNSKEAMTGDLIIFHAGSLSVPFKEIAGAFMRENPGVDVLLEPAGSVASARKITDLGRPCDILASSDYHVIDDMLIPHYATWNLRFAANEMVIAFTDRSRSRDLIDSLNWYQILLKNDVLFGRADPNQDPCGYRTIFTIRLAQKYSGDTTLTARFLEKDISYMRPKEVDLMPLLETGTVDYIFIYRSVAEQHHVRYLLLPDEINLKNPAFNDLYASVSAEILGEKPGERVTVHGEAMVYGVTVLTQAPDREAAMAFMQFLMDPAKGMAIMERNGQPSVVPSFCTQYDALPMSLKKYARND
jgi:molybdate/tungstate transport system substrate-binding protein